MSRFNIEELAYQETPCYYYDMRVLRQVLYQAKKESKKHNYHIHYAIKANYNPEILSVIQDFGFGADCVSGQEIELALKKKFNANQIFFAGVGKTDAEIQLAITHNIFCFNVESIEELKVIGHWADKMNTPTRIALRINPNINAGTHRYITTGLEENKFGIPSWNIEKALKVILKYKNIQIIGLHFHVGSQIMDLRVYKELCFIVNKWNHWFMNKGYELSILNLGGGLGINYEEPDKEASPNFKNFFQVFAENLQVRNNQKVYFELGRSLVGNCGSLISKVLYIKKGKTKKFAILDAGMTELLRPALYEAYHKIEKLSLSHSENYYDYDIVGPICESSDCFSKDVRLKKLKRGDLLAIRSAGAYGEVMASRYNLRRRFTYFYKY